MCLFVCLCGKEEGTGKKTRGTEGSQVDRTTKGRERSTKKDDKKIQQPTKCGKKKQKSSVRKVKA